MYIARETLVYLVEDYPELGHNIAQYVYKRYQQGKTDIEPVRVRHLRPYPRTFARRNAP